MAYVYKHIRKDNNQPFYVGVGGLISFDNYQRALAKNWKGLRSRSEFWFNYSKLYGFIVEIVLDNCTPEEAFSKEIELIKLYGRQDINTGILVNHTNGGEGLHGHSTETRRKCGIKNIGKIQSKETKLKRSLALKGRKRTDEERMKISKAHLGRKKSESHLKKLIENSSFKKGHIPWNKGLKYKTKINEQTD